MVSETYGVTPNVERHSGFTFTFRVTIIISVYVPGRSRVVQKLKKWVCTSRDRPGTKTETISKLRKSRLVLLYICTYIFVLCTSKASKASKVRTWCAHLLDALELKLIEQWVLRA